MRNEEALRAEDECIEKDVSFNKSNHFDLIDIFSRSFVLPDDTLDGYSVLLESTSNFKSSTVENLSCAICQNICR